MPANVLRRPYKYGLRLQVRLENSKIIVNALQLVQLGVDDLRHLGFDIGQQGHVSGPLFALFVQALLDCNAGLLDIDEDLVAAPAGGRYGRGAAFDELLGFAPLLLQFVDVVKAAFPGVRRNASCFQEDRPGFPGFGFRNPLVQL